MNFNEKCFKFQQDFIDFFNNEEELPFLLKYYLLDQIWKEIYLNKKQLSLTKTVTKQIPITIEEKKDQNK